MQILGCTHRKCTKIDHILGHKTNLNKFKIIQTKQNLFSNWNVIRSKNNSRKISEKKKNPPNLKTKLHIQNNSGINGEIKRNFNDYSIELKWKHNITKFVKRS